MEVLKIMTGLHSGTGLVRSINNMTLTFYFVLLKIPSGTRKYSCNFPSNLSITYFY